MSWREFKKQPIIFRKKVFFAFLTVFVVLITSGIWFYQINHSTKIQAAGTKTWSAVANGNWEADANWTPVGAPVAGDDVVFDGTSTANCTVTTYTGANGIADGIGSISVNAGYSGTINFQKKPSQNVDPYKINIIGDFIVNSGTVISEGDITVAHGGVTDGRGNEFVAGNITIGSGVSFNANGKGFVASTGPGAGGNGSGFGNSGGGAGHAGVGTVGAPRSGTTAGSGGGSYDSDVSSPNGLGSGGGNGYDCVGGVGGGALILTVSGTLNVTGSIAANGVGTNCYASGGGGAGGSIKLTAGTISGTGGSVNAIGGTAVGTYPGGGSGGGRIYLEYTNDSYAGGISSLSRVANGGGGYAAGTPGSIYVKNGSNVNLTYDNASNVSLPGIYTPQNLPLAVSNLLVTGKAQVRVDVNATPASSTLAISNDLTVNTSSELKFTSDNDGTPTTGAGAIITAANVSIDATSSINSNGTGFIHDAGYSNGKGLVAATRGGGGAFGGAGGASNDGGAGGQVYGGATDVAYIGSGGGAANLGGAGGGLISMNISGTLTNAGTISVNGANGATNGGGGSGGGIQITTVNCTSSGTISANGGNGASGAGGGGGGRIYIYYTGSCTPSPAPTVTGGTGANNGSNGTVEILTQLAPASPTLLTPAPDSGNIPGVNWIAADSGDNWSYRKPITISHTNVTSTLTNFPAKIEISGDTDIGAQAKSDLTDLRFTSSDTITILPAERETGTVSAGSASGIFWVQVPSISSTVDTTIFAYYGNSSASAQANPQNVWTTPGYAVVQHNNDAGPTTVADSTGNGWTGTQSGGITFGAGGRIGPSLQYAGAQTLNLPAGNLLLGAQPWTFSFWANPTSLTAYGPGIADLKTDQDASYGLSFNFSSPSGSGYQYLNMIPTSGHGWTPLRYTTAITAGAWHYYTFTYTGTGTTTASNFALYIDGVAKSLVSSGYNGPGTITNSVFGTNPAGVPFTGYLDEMRVASNMTKSADWIKFEYYNQNDTAGQISYGAQAALGNQIATNVSKTPAFTFSTTDPNGDWVRYKLQLATDSAFTQNLSEFVQGSDVGGQTQTSNGLTGVYSGQDSQSSTAYASGTTATFTISGSTPLTNGAIYYWRVYAIDPGGSDSWSSPSSTFSFEVLPPGPIDHFTLTAYSTSVIAGSALATGPTVTAYDADGNVKTDYTGQVWFTSTDGAATLTYNTVNHYTFTTGGGQDNGVHSFAGSDFVLATSGNQTITLKNGDGKPDVISDNILVTGGSITGTVYGTDETTVVATGPLVRVKVNGLGDYSATANGSGVYTIPGVDMNASDSLTIYLDTGGGISGATFTVSTGSTMSNIHIYQDRATTRCDNSCSLTNVNINAWDKDNDGDIHAASDGTNLVVDNDYKLLVTANTFAPGGTITNSTGGGSAYSGNLEIKSGATLNMAGNALSISGSYSTAGTFAPGGNTTTFAATTTGKTITSAGAHFNNIIFNGVGGGWTLADALIADATFTLTAGTFNASTFNVTCVNMTATGTLTRTYNLGSGLWTVSGNWAAHGTNLTKTYGTSTVDLTGTGSLTNGDFYNLNCAHNGKTTTVVSNLDNVYNILSIYSGGTLAGSTINLWKNNGDPIVNTGAIITVTVAYNSTADITVAGQNFSGEVDYGSSANDVTYTLSSDITTTGDIYVYNWTAGGAKLSTLNASFHNISCRNLYFGYTGLSFKGKVNFGSGTHTISGDLTRGGTSTTNAIDFGTGSVSVGGNIDFTGITVTPGTGTQTVTMNAGDTGNTITSAGAHFNNLTFNNAAGGWSFSDAAAVDGNLTVSNSEVAGNGVNFNNQAVDISGNFQIDAGKLTAGSSLVNVGGNWTRAGGTFVANTSGVTFDGSGAQAITSGGQSFNNLTTTNASAAGLTFTDGATLAGTFTNITPSSKVTFNNGDTYAFNAINLNGADTSTRISLLSATPGTTWLLNVADLAPTADYVSVQDSDASGGSQIDATTGSFNLGNNTNWLFGVASIVVSPSSATLDQGTTQTFTATAYDSSDIAIPGTVFAWSVINGGGAIDNSGLFASGTTAGSYAGTVQATSGGVNGFASVTVNAAPVPPTPPTPTPMPEPAVETAVGGDLKKTPILPTETAVPTSQKKEDITLPDFQFYVVLESGNIPLNISDDNNIETIINSNILAEVSADLFAKKVNVITISTYGSTYLMNLLPDKNKYQAVIPMPAVKGDFELRILIVYEDGTIKEIKKTISVDPQGFVYTRSSNYFGLGKKQEVRIADATVTLYKQDGGEYKIWDSAGKQPNPVTTNQSGEYAFWVPSGDYYMQVEKAGYKTVKTVNFEVENLLVVKNIEIEPRVKPWTWLIVISVVLVAGAYLLIRRRGVLKIAKGKK